MKILIYILTLVFVAASVACHDKDDFAISTEPDISEVAAIELSDTVLSNVVTLDEARRELEIFLKDFPTLTKKGGKSTRTISGCFTLESEKKSLKKSTGDTSTAKIHVFNFEDEGGFAIMSATRDLPALLAITDGGSIDTSKVIDNPGLVIFLTNLEAKISLPGRYYPDIPIEKIWKEYGDSIKTFYKPNSGYCKVYWHQKDPYNRYCFTDSTNLPAYVGCVAVATAQLMSMFKYPEFYCHRPLNWDLILRNDSADELSWLMRRLGDEKNLDMEYGAIGVNGSCAYTSNIPRTLKNFGFYSGGVYGEYRDETVCAELKNGYPVIIDGCSHLAAKACKQRKVFGLKCSETSTATGHTWLAHGLMVRSRIVCVYKQRYKTNFKTLVSRKIETENYILCNMGWGCFADNTNGYYLSGIFDASGRGAPYNEREHLSKSEKDYYYQFDICTVTKIRQ